MPKQTHTQPCWLKNLTTTHQQENPESTKRQISIFSWNILAHSLFEKTTKHYPHISENQSCFTWFERLNKTLHEISLADADIVCLQEVDHQAFEQDLLPLMQEMNYDGILQKPKKGGKSNHSVGLATFWKSQRFELEKVNHRSRTMITALRDNSDNRADDSSHIIAIVNAHLEAAPWKTTSRLKQLQNTLQELDRTFSFHDLVICGDMNCELQRSACSTYLESGCLRDKEIVDWGETVDPETIKDIAPHPFRMKSAYPMNLEKNDYITFLCRPGDYVTGIDHIWYHSNPEESRSSMRVVGIRKPYHSIKDLNTMMKTGLPNSFHPSDHLPIGCILEWDRPQTQKLREGSAVLRCKQDMRSEHEGQDQNDEELMVKIEELLNACPFESNQQRLELEYVVSSVEDLPSKGKPTAFQLEQLKDRKVRKKQLLESLTEEARFMVEEVFRLSKEATKLKSKKIKQ